MVGKLIIPDDQKRTYDLFVLPNHLEVITISDPETTTSSAAMDVRMGANSDPKDLPGLAHFIEHMLFLGTEKFPEESSYQKFLADHGGYSNASTGLENTEYHFTVTSDHFHHALDMFSSFFTCPLFTASATERELKAIDSEHSKNIQNDAFRFFQFLKDTSNPDYPFSKFSTGNLVTLKEEPTAKGIDTRLEMIEHYKKNYSANLMKLVVYGKEPNDVLRQWVEALFSSIPNQDLPPPIFPGKAFTEKEIGHWYYVLPIRTKHSLILHFPLDIGNEQYTTKEGNYFSHLIGHESEGSILFVLKERGWAENLNAGCGMISETWSLFTVDIEMTKEGMNHIEEIIDLFFQYVRMLNDAGIQQAVYNELKNIAEMEFRYLEPSKPDDFCCQVAHNMNIFSAENAIAGDYLFFEYNAEKIADLLQRLNPNNMNIYIMAHDFAEKCTETISPWYSIKYSRQPVDPEKIARWAGLSAVSALHLPEPNPFIPENMDLKPVAKDTPENPVIIYEGTDPSIKVWFKQDNYYRKPKVNMHWNLLSRAGYATARQRVLNRLFAMAVTERLNAFAYHASVAHLDFNLAAALEGMYIIITGFNDKVGVFVQEIFRHLKTIDIDEALFVMVRDRLKKTLENFQKEQAYHIVMDAAAVCLMTPRWSYIDTLPLVTAVTLTELREFTQMWLNQFHLEGYIQGNMLKDEAVAIVEQVKDSFMKGVLGLQSNQLPELRTGKIPKGKEWLRPVKCTTDDGTNSALHTVYQIGLSTPRNLALTEVFVTMVQSLFFTQLRTIETLGYIVSMFLESQEDGGQPGPCAVVCIVQSGTHEPLYLYSRVYGFFEALEEYLQDCKEADVQGVVSALVAKRRERPKTLVEDAAEAWREIQRQELMWNRKEREIVELELLTKADVLKFFQKYISNHSQSRRHLSTMFYATQFLDLYEEAVKDQSCVHKCIPTQLPDYRQGKAKEAAPSTEVQALLAGLPAEIATLLQKLPTEMLSQMAANMPPEAVADLSGAPLSDVQQMVDAMLAGAEPKEASPVDDGAKSPLLGIERFNAALPQVDLYYILDVGRWKQSLPTFPARLLPN